MVFNRKKSGRRTTFSKPRRVRNGIDNDMVSTNNNSNGNGCSGRFLRTRCEGGDIFCTSEYPDTIEYEGRTLRVTATNNKGKDENGNWIVDIVAEDEVCRQGEWVVDNDFGCQNVIGKNTNTTAIVRSGKKIKGYNRRHKKSKTSRCSRCSKVSGKGKSVRKVLSNNKPKRRYRKK